MFLAAVWILLSGHPDPLLLAFGAASVILVLVLAHRMDLVDAEGHPVQLSWKAPLYVVWLVGQIVVANGTVVREVLRRKVTVSPRLIQVPGGQRDDLHQVIYANSITLTPGTVSVRLQDGEIVVHALTEDLARDIEGGTMARHVRRLTGDD